MTDQDKPAIPDPVGELNQKAAAADAKAKTADEGGLSEPDWAGEEAAAGVNQKADAAEDGATMEDEVWPIDGAESMDAAYAIRQRLLLAGAEVGLFEWHNGEPGVSPGDAAAAAAISGMANGMFARMLANAWRGKPFGVADLEFLRASLMGAAVKLNMRSSYLPQGSGADTFEQACDVANWAMLLAYNARQIAPDTLMVPLVPAVSAVPAVQQTGPGITFMSQPVAARRGYVDSILQESLLALSGDEHAPIRARINETRQVLSQIGRAGK